MTLHTGLAALTLALAVAPAEDPAASAKAFVARLYDTARPELSDAQTYTPELAALIARGYARSAETEDPDVVGNALCDCQDMTEFRPRITVASATSSAASVQVVLTGGADAPRRFLLKLVRTAGGWRVADSISEGSSYAANLRAELAGK